MQITNVSPYGALEVPLLRAVVDAEETVEVTEDQARVLLLQADNYAPADDEAHALLEQLAAEQAAADEIADGGLPKTSDLLAVWRAYAAAQGDPDAGNKTKKQLIEQYSSAADVNGEGE